MKLRVNTAIWIILAVSLTLRILLIMQGGLFFNPDEYRYNRAILLLHHLSHGEVRDALSLFYQYAEHSGYMLVATIPAALQGFLDVCGLAPERTMKLAAIVLSFFSVANLWLVYGLARRTGRSNKEALLALFFMACTCTMYRYSRHLLPYDMSIFFALLTLFMLHGKRTLLRMALVGISAFMVFMTYNAFWLLSGMVVLYGVYELRSQRKVLAILLGGYVVLPLIQVVLGEALGFSYLQSLRNFSATITQGGFAEGYWIGWAYLWHSEHLLLLVWLSGIVLTLSGKKESKLLVWLGFVGVIYLVLVLGSNVFEKFVVYGRSMRQMVPFLCLVAAAGCMRVPRILPAVILIVIIQGVTNAIPVLQQRFPAEVLAEVRGEYEDLSVMLAVRGPELHVDEDLLGPSRYVLVNHRALVPIIGTNDLPEGTVLYSTPHPFQSKLYQYNGLTAAERRIVDSSNQSIRLIDTAEQ